MRAVIQRVSRAAVEVDGREVGAIGRGLVVLLGVGKGDTERDACYVAEKVLNLRVFPDGSGRFQYSVAESRGGVLVVSQFTLYGDCRRGRRPDFTAAAPPDEARRLYEHFISLIKEAGQPVAAGVFGAHMRVSLENDGPVTIILDSRSRNGGV